MDLCNRLTVTEHICEMLKPELQDKVAFYHASLSQQQRSALHKQFICDDILVTK